MPHELKKLTPNLVVSNVERSMAFYRDVLGFRVELTVPDAAPYVFASVQSGPVEIFLNASEPAVAEYPAFKYVCRARSRMRIASERQGPTCTT